MAAPGEGVDQGEGEAAAEGGGQNAGAHLRRRQDRRRDRWHVGTAATSNGSGALGDRRGGRGLG